MRKRGREKPSKREGSGVSPLCAILPATSKPSGMTGTGAPVTEQLRCRLAGELGWYRGLSSSLYWGGDFFILYLIMEVISNE